MSPSFSSRLIAWQKQHGRHDLPWQNTCDPYAIWVSEIMLQQTQVAAVIPYYQRFMARFPDVASLAQASEDTVLQHWSGLGYYSRARNLHAAAQQLVTMHGGVFPQEMEAIVALPGIGRSTAAAIAAFAFGQRRAILDGNVKRVLTRCFGVAGWPGQPAIENRLWQLAEELLPEQEIVAYTQGLMDLGASLCARSKPRCGDCPMAQDCVAYLEQRTGELPTPKPRKTIPEKEIVMLILRAGNEILLEKRPPTGIWGGLWSLPEAPLDADFARIAMQRFGVQAIPQTALPRLTHTFTHFRLYITPQVMAIQDKLPQAQEPGLLWLDVEDAAGAALPTPVKKLLAQLASSGAK